MKKFNLGNSNINASAISLGCMRINGLEQDKAQKLIEKAYDLGINFFDHADIYVRGECEQIFGKILKNSIIKREDIIIQSKCGIIPKKMFDFSKEHILNSVDGILKRLNTDYLDVLLLHRPDTLVEPEEVSEAFDSLHKQGKVKAFGVSNHNPMQMELLKKYLKQDIIANQLQLSIPHSSMISSGLEVNMATYGAINRDGSVLDYCRLNNITIQAWSPFQYGFFEGVFLNSEKYKELNEVIDDLAKKYNVTNMAIATAWILRHPANMQVIVGTTNIDRLEAISKATNITLTREEWYKLYISAGNILP
ncbi:aldo/keto reductase [[Clostridium] colinum]|uniref:aldo/keto reductase n=1 Tax=[Clostridium] colinum TaxID=36835 RepID=UPI0020249B6C|nr:aldo/keto reductase [[Clostridium] colinum]